MIRFLLLRFLPRRILPLLMLFEAYQLVQRLRRRDEPAPTPVSYGLAPTTTERPAPLDPALAPSGAAILRAQRDVCSGSKVVADPRKARWTPAIRWSPSASGARDPGGCRPSSGQPCCVLAVVIAKPWANAQPAPAKPVPDLARGGGGVAPRDRRGRADDRPGGHADRRSDLAGAARTVERSDARVGPGGERAPDARCAAGDVGRRGHRRRAAPLPRCDRGSDWAAIEPEVVAGSGPGRPASPRPDLARHRSVHRRARRSTTIPRSSPSPCRWTSDGARTWVTAGPAGGRTADARRRSTTPCRRGDARPVGHRRDRAHRSHAVADRALRVPAARR